MTTYTAESIVFIDSRVANLQALLDGLQAGETAYVLDAGSDGIQQIADILAANNVTDLSSISIVGHGQSGALEIGSSLITDANLAAHSNALAEIGAALAQNGNIKLYGCDIALGTTGQQFINDFSTFAGGAPVEASTQLVGSALEGGSWTLNAASNGTAPINDANAPFTSAALANFSGELAAVPNTELWIAASGGQNGIVHVDNNNGSNTASGAVTLYNGSTKILHPSDLALDVNADHYFFVDSDGSGHERILEGTLSQAVGSPTATPTFVTLYSDTLASADISAIGIDTINHQIYFTENITPSGASKTVGEFLRISDTGANQTAVTLGTVSISGTNVGFRDFALDLPHNTAYFAESSAHLGTGTVTLKTNFLYKATGLTSTASSVTLSQLPMSPNDSTNGGNFFPSSLGQIWGLDVDTTSETIYFTSQPVSSTTHGGIFSYAINSNTSGNYSTVWLQPTPAASSSSSGLPDGGLFHIQIDHATGLYYVSDKTSFIGVTPTVDARVYVGSLSGGTVAQKPTAFLQITNTNGLFPEGLALDNAPSLTITALTPTFTESTLNPASSNNTPVALISGASASDTDNSLLAGGAVTIGSFFAGDTLSFSTAGTSITGSYNTSSGVLTLTGIDSFAHYQTVLATVQFTSTSDNPTNYGSDNGRALTWVVNDGLLTSPPQTSTVTVIGVNDPPTLSLSPTSAQYTEQLAAATLSGTLTVIDPDNLNLANATVSITGGTFAGDADLLSTSTAGTTITASYDSNNERLVLSGSDTLADYQTVLRKITFSSTSDNPTNYGSNTTRTVTWLLNDGSGSFNLSTVVSETLTITAVNDPPTLTNVASSVSFTEGTAVTLSSAVTVTDPDNLNLASATVKIVGGTFPGDGDVLATSTSTTAITASYNTATETLVLSGTDTLAHYQTVLDKITFSSGSNPDDYGSNKTRTVTWVLNDGSGSFNLSTVQNETISITAINDPPVLSNVATTATYVENAAPLTLSNVLTVSDVDSLNLTNATVKIAGGTFTGDGDALAADTSGTSISASYNSTTETLVLSGSDTLAHYQTVLERVTFVSSSDNPDDYGSNPTRTVTWIVNDGSGSNNLSSFATTTLNITAVNDKPTLTGTVASVSFSENGAAATLSPNVTASDVDSLTLAGATVSITGGTFGGDGDVLSANTAGTSITASYDAGNERLVLSGSDTLANYQTVLDTVTFSSTSDNPDNYGSNKTRTVTWVLNDGAGSNNLSTAQSETVSITAINDAPTLSNVPSIATYNENTTLTLASLAAVTDPDSLNLANATVKIVGGTFANDGDVLATDTSGTSITASYNSSTETLTLTGSDSLTHYQTVLDHITFSSSSKNPDDYGSNPTRTVTWLLNDGAGSFNLSTQTETVNITAVNDAPTLANAAGTVSYTENAAGKTLASVAAVSDPDNLNLVSATVSITGGSFANDGDVLAASTAGTSITASYDSGNERLVLSGSDTLANYQTVLDTVTFSSTSDNPDNFGANLTRTVSWVLNDGSGSSNLSAAQIETVSITAINDAPTLSSVASSVTVSPNVVTAISPTLSVSDPDSFSLVNATVSITGGTFVGDGDVLAATNAGSVMASYDVANERLVLTGSDSLANYKLVLDSVTFDATGADPTQGGAHPTRTLTWVVNDGSGSFNTNAPVTTTITISNGPALNPPAHATFTEGPSSVTLAPTLTVSDSNAGVSIASATVAITSGAFAGDVLAVDAAVLATTSITENYDATNKILTLTGSDSTDHYQQVLDTLTFSTASDNPTDFGSDPSRTLTWTITDVPGSTGSATSTIDITAVNDPPTLAGVPASASASFIENGASVVLAPVVAVTDPDNLNLASATVSIVDGTFAGDGDVLAATGTASITVSYDSTTETLTLTGSDTLADYESVLDTIAFSSTSDNPDNYGANQTRRISWVLNDGSGASNLSAAQTETVTIAAVNDAPTLAVAASVGFTLGQTVTLSPTASVSDPDSLGLVGATVSITGPSIANGTFTADNTLTGDVLSAVTAGNIMAVYNSMTETLTLSGADTLANYQAVLDSITFASGANPSDSGSDPTRTVSWVVDDGSSPSNTSAPQTTTISIHVGPGIFVPASAAYTEQQVPSTTLAPAVSLNDTNGTTTLTSATVALTGGTFSGDQDTLYVNGATSGSIVNGPFTINFSYDSTAETLTLLGSDTFADYQSALETITFLSSSDNPTDYGSKSTRTVTWTVVDDSSSFSTGTATSTVNITGVNDPPTLATVAASASFVENAGAVVLSNALSVSDPDNLNLASATIAITSGTFAGDGDVLAVNTAGTSITASYNAATETLTLTGSDILADYQQVLRTLTFNSTSENPDDFGSFMTRQVTWVLNDGAGSSNTSTPTITTVSITAVNDAPTLSNVTASDSFTVGSTIVLSPTITISDVDNLTLTSATVSITSGTFLNDGDVLAAANAGNITSIYDSTNERLILTGADTLAEYQLVLDSVTFSSGNNPNNGNLNTTRTVTWVVNDGGGVSNLSAAATTTINIAHEPPTLTSVAPSLDFTQGNTTTISPSITVTDFDSANLVSGTVSITGGTFGGDGDVLSATPTGAIIVSYDTSTERLTLSGTDTLAHYQSVLDSVKFSSGTDPTNHGANPIRTVTWVVNDGNASLGSSSLQTTTITITSTENPPTLSNVAASASFTENSTVAVSLASALSISDPDSTTMTSATVSIAGGTFVGDNDVLGFSTAGTLVASYDSTNERLVLTGPDTLANYKSVLDSVTFIAPGDNPTGYGSDPTRTITWVVKDDFDKASNIATTTVSITAFNDAPTLTSVTPTVSFLDGSTLQLSPSLSVSDPDNLNLANATIKITGFFAGDGDQLTANVAGTHITASYDAATETMVLTGSDPVATYQAVLESITFSSGSNPTNFGSNPTRTVTWVVNDGSGTSNLSGVSTETINITAINDPPALSNIPSAINFTEGNTLTLAGSASLTDSDDVDLASVSVHILGTDIVNGTFTPGGQPTGDVLSVTTAGTNVTASYDSATETLVLSGVDTPANYQLVLHSLTFSSGDNPDNYTSDPTRIVTWVANDGSASNNLSTVQTETISITPVNDPPTLSNVPGTGGFTENGSAVLLSPTFTLIGVTDPDNLVLSNATVSITGGTFAGDGDVLATDTTGTAITASYDSSTETLVLSGSDTLTDYRNVLSLVTFQSAGDNPDNYGSNTTRTVTWVLNDGSASSNLSNVATTTVSITAINDAPTLANVPASANYTEGAAPVTLAISASVSDPDNLKLTNATVKITGGTFAGDGDVLAATAVGSITVAYNAATETLTLTGSDTLANYQQVLDSLTFVANGDNPDDFGSAPTRTVTWVLNDGSGSFALSTTQTETISITAINDAPTLASVVGVTAYTENAAPITVSPSISVSDPDNLKLANATVSIANGFSGDGDVLAVNTAGTGITASYNSTTEVLTLTGSDTLAHYQSVLDSLTFSSTSDNPTDYGSFLSRVLTWTVNDGGASNNTNAAQFTTVAITAVNDAPTLTNVASNVQFLPQHTVTVSPAITVADPDNQTLSNATVKITGGTFAGDGDVLAANVSGTSITASYNAATETLTLTGSDTLAHYQAVLDSVTFSSGANPSNNNVNHTRTLTWVVNDGSGSNNLSTTATTTITIGAQVRNDFDGDNKSDLLLQNQPFAGNPNVMVDLLVGNGSIIASSGTITTPNGWTVQASGDFNNDNKADIILQASDGLPQIWLMNGTSVTSTVTLPNSGPTWHVIATADFNGDGNADILWQNNDGAADIWLMNGTSMIGAALLPFAGPGWHAIGAGDVNGDGKADILWQNTDGAPAIWEMNGVNLIGGAVLPNSGPSWHAINFGDFTGDGKAEILWQNTDGNTIIWLLNGMSLATGVLLPYPGATWHAIGPSDFNGDGKADIVWQNDDGTPAIWLMNGFNLTSGTVLPNPGATWHVKDDGPIDGDPTGAGSQPALHLSTPDAATAVPVLSAPDVATGVPMLSAPDFAAGSPALGPAAFPSGLPAQFAAPWQELTGAGSGDPTLGRWLHVGTG